MNEIRYSSYNPIIPPEIEKFFPFGFEIEERNEEIIDAIEAVFGKNGVVSLMGPHLPTFASIYAHVQKTALGLVLGRTVHDRGRRLSGEDDVWREVP